MNRLRIILSLFLARIAILFSNIRQYMFLKVYACIAILMCSSNFLLLCWKEKYVPQLASAQELLSCHWSFQFRDALLYE
jgi:hypothetical protein